MNDIFNIMTLTKEELDTIAVKYHIKPTRNKADPYVYFRGIAGDRWLRERYLLGPERLLRLLAPGSPEAAREIHILYLLMAVVKRWSKTEHEFDLNLSIRTFLTNQHLWPIAIHDVGAEEREEQEKSARDRIQADNQERLRKWDQHFRDGPPFDYYHRFWEYVLDCLDSMEVPQHYRKLAAAAHGEGYENRYKTLHPFGQHMFIIDYGMFEITRRLA